MRTTDAKLVTRPPGSELLKHLRAQRSRHPGEVILRLCGYVVLQSRLRWTTKSPPRWGSREGANWGAVVRIAAAPAVTLTRPATRGADDGRHKYIRRLRLRFGSRWVEPVDRSPRFVRHDWWRSAPPQALRAPCSACSSAARTPRHRRRGSASSCVRLRRAQAGDMADEDLTRAEGMAVRAA